MVGLAVLAGLSLVLIAGYALIPGWSEAGTDWVNAYSGASALALVTLVGVVARRRPQPQWAWMGVVATVTLLMLGDVVYDLRGDDPVASFADIFYVAGHLLLIAAAAQFHRTLVPSGRDPGSLLETAMVAVAAIFAAWLFIIEPSLGVPGVGTAARWLVALYPALGVIALLLLVRTSLAGGMRWSMVALGAGTAILMASDAAFAGMQQTGAFETNALPVIEAGWLAFYLSAAVAITLATIVDEGRAEPTGGAFGPVRLLAAGVALIAMPALYAVAIVAGLEPHIGGFLVATLALIPLVLWRGATLQAQIDASHTQLAHRETYYRSIATHASDVFLVTDFAGVIRDASGAAEALLDHSAADLVGMRLNDVAHPADHPTVTSLLDGALQPGASSRTAEIRVRARDGDHWVSVRCANLADEPAVGGIVVNLHDIHARKQTEAALEHQALHDGLTDLANRTLLHDRVAHAMARRSRTGQDVALIVVGLDGFKAINDGVGLNAGDQLLTTVGRRLAIAVRPDDTVARIGGDQFALLLESDDDLEQQAADLGERIRHVIAEPIEIGGIPIVMTASVGVTVASKDGGASADDLLRDADTAMHAAKAAGRDQIMRYRTTMQQASLNRVQMAADLRNAVSRDQLVLHYQSIHRLSDGAPVGIEALVRWRHPTRGLLLPWRFVPIAEQAGTIIEVGAWVLEDACRYAARWFQQLDGSTPMTVGVNLSPRQLRDQDLAARIDRILTDTGLEASQLVLELTETALVMQPEVAVERLREIKELGVRLAIDDFGVGYASLSYLRQFPADILKIDRSYIAAIRQPGEVPALVRGLLDLGRTLGLEVIAEGVETETQRQTLQAEGCHYGQGFLFAKAVPGNEVGVAGAADRGP